MIFEKLEKVDLENKGFEFFKEVIYFNLLKNLLKFKLI